jgi:hypothetical protein
VSAVFTQGVEAESRFPPGRPVADFVVLALHGDAPSCSMIKAHLGADVLLGSVGRHREVTLLCVEIL